MAKPFRNIYILCICVWSQPSFKYIESYATKNVNNIISNNESKNLLKTFLRIGHRCDKPNALILLQCYEKCDQILSDLDSYQDHFDNLLEVCPTYLWEQIIWNIYEIAARNIVNRQLETVLNALKKECLSNTECDHDFTRFRRNLISRKKKDFISSFIEFLIYIE